MKRIILLPLFLIPVCAGTNSVYATDVYSARITGGCLELRFDGFDQHNYLSAPGTVINNITAGFDWLGLTMNVQAINTSFSGASYTMTRTYTTGPGQTKTLTAQVNVNPFLISAANRPTYTLYPGDNGLYSAGYSGDASWSSLPLSGNVVIWGPTQSTTIPFSIILPAVAYGPSLFNVDTTHYPQDLDLNFYSQYEPAFNGTYHGTCTGTWYDINGNTYSLADAIVDGVDVNVKLGAALPWSVGTYSLSPIPEPGSLGLLLLGLAGCILRRALDKS